MNDEALERLRRIEELQRNIIQNFDDSTSAKNRLSDMEQSSREDGAVTEQYFKEREANERRAEGLRKARAKRSTTTEKPPTRKRVRSKGGANAVVEEPVDE